MRRGSEDKIVKNEEWWVSILPRLATGIIVADPAAVVTAVSILPRLATGITYFCSMPSLHCVSILPRLATGIILTRSVVIPLSFYSSPSCDGDPMTRKVY